MSKSQLTIKRAHVFLGGPYHGAVKMVTDGATHSVLPRKSKPKVAFDDVRARLRTELYVRHKYVWGDVFVHSGCGPNECQRLAQEYRREQTSQNHDSR